MFELNSVKKEYADKLLFENLNLTVYDGERIGIVGENGSGKSTLLKLITQEEAPDKGSVYTYGMSIGYLKQISEYTQEDFLSLFENSSFLSQFFKIKSSFNLSKHINFSKESLSSLSGGEKTKLLLSHILSKEPDLLILDEPTNHMDQEGVDWLIKTLDSFVGTVVIVSHDRYILNKVANKIVEIENGKVNEYYGNYNDYKQQKDLFLASQKQKYLEQQALERKINNQINKLKSWKDKADREVNKQGTGSESRLMGVQTLAKAKAKKLAQQVKSKISRLEQSKKDFIEKPYEEGKIYYRLDSNVLKNKLLIKAIDLSKAFGNNVLFKKANFNVVSGEKIWLKGNNGCGKTSLLKILLGEDQDFNGSIWKTSSLKIAYLSQDVLDIDENLTVMDIARQGGSNEYTTLFLSNLRNMNMQRQVFDRKISTLSLGERMRIKMCEIILSDFNLLVLDEPTNHLDLANKTYLEKILKDFNGTFLLVSHDRTLAQNVCSKILEIKNNQIITEEI